MIPRKKLPSPRYNIHDVSRGSISTDEFLYRWARNDFSFKICWKEQILPRNLQNLGKAIQFPYPLFCVFFLRSSSARVEIEFEYWEFFLFY